MDLKLDNTAPGLFERLSTILASQFSRSIQFGRQVLDASLVEVHVLDGDRLRLIDKAGRATTRSGSAQRLLPELLDARDLLIRPVEAAGRRGGTALMGAHLPIRLGDGTFAGCYTVLYPAKRGAFGDLEHRTVREVVKILVSYIEFARRAAPERAAFNGVAASSPDGIVVTDENAVVIAWNAGAESLFGYAADDAIGRSMDLIIEPDPRNAHLGGFARLLGDGYGDLVGRSVDLFVRCRDGRQVPIELSLSEWVEGGRRRFGAIMRDTSERQGVEERLRSAAMVDHLTGLANRSSLDRRLAELLNAGRRATLLLIDLDGFKEVNDSLGHLAGDVVLAEVACRLRHHARPGHFVARMGGDEFVVIVEDSANPLEGDWLGETLIDAIEEAISVDDVLVTISASVGIACSTAACTPQSLLSDADLALYKAKRDGRGRTQLFLPQLRQRIVEKGLARAELAAAWERNQFELYYQPQVALGDGRLVGAEALLRWVHPTRGVISPGFFLPLLETDTLAISVGDWIIDEACRQAAAWRASLLPTFRVAVNLFALQFKSGDIVGEVVRALERNGLPPEALELEITENTILKSDERILRQLKRLRELGVGLAFDDFGTGYASLSMLRDYPVSKIKIDRSFVSGADASDNDRAITRALVQMAEGLGITVIAEGIETADQHAKMREQGCHLGQGYLYSRPVAAGVFSTLYDAEAPRQGRLAG